MAAPSRDASPPAAWAPGAYWTANAAATASSSATRRIRRSNTLHARRLRWAPAPEIRPMVDNRNRMGEVVKLEKPSPKARKPVGKPPRRGPRRSRNALVLGGGGFTGGVYEIGALRALDLLAVNRTVNEFDVYVGTSAGSFVASLAANGVTPEEMMRVVNQQVPTPFEDVDRSTLMRPNYLEFVQATALLPLRMLGLARNVLSQIRSASVVDVAVGLAEALPSGIYDGNAIEGY